jgi:hypothetical protein
LDEALRYLHLDHAPALNMALKFTVGYLGDVLCGDEDILEYR